MIDLKDRIVSDHIDYLDGWRGLAIVFLLIGHFFPVPGINLGVLGVNLFFVLSGYLMGQLLFIKKIQIPIFYKRRISRIVPAHLFFIACILLFNSITARPISWGETTAALFFLNNYLTSDLGHTVMPFGHIWSLCVEEHSYIALSLVALAARRRPTNTLWIIAILTLFCSSMGFWYWLNYAGSELAFDKWIRSEVSAFGIFSSVLFLLILKRRPIPQLPILLCPLLLIAGILLHWWSIPAPIQTTVGVGILALTINLLPNVSNPLTKVLSFRPLRLIGLWSFSIYLWQQPFYLAWHIGAMTNYLALVLAIACGVASFYFLERPIRSHLNRGWGSVGPSGRIL